MVLTCVTMQTNMLFVFINTKLNVIVKIMSQNSRTGQNVQAILRAQFTVAAVGLSVPLTYQTAKMQGIQIHTHL